MYNNLKPKLRRCDNFEPVSLAVPVIDGIRSGNKRQISYRPNSCILMHNAGIYLVLLSGKKNCWRVSVDFLLNWWILSFVHFCGHSLYVLKSWGELQSQSDNHVQKFGDVCMSGLITKISGWDYKKYEMSLFLIQLAKCKASLVSRDLWTENKITYPVLILTVTRVMCSSQRSR